MKCNEIHEMLPDLAAGVTAGTSEVNDHLRTCAVCTGTLDEFRKTMALLDEWQAPEPSPYFDTRLKARLREEATKQPSPWYAWFSRPVLVGSMAALLVIGGTMLHLELKNTKQPPVVADFQPGTAVGDLQSLDKNHDIFTDSDPDTDSSLLDDLQVQQDEKANP